MHIHSIKLPLVELKNINVVFEQKKALQNINLTLYPNSIITIVGPNGGGKSTLLKVLLKLLPPTSGQVIYHKNLRIGYVPQKIHLDHSLPITVERFLSLKKGFLAKQSKTPCHYCQLATYIKIAYKNYLEERCNGYS